MAALHSSLSFIAGRRAVVSRTGFLELRRRTAPYFRIPPYSTRSASTKDTPVSPHIGFYQSFGRPIAKVFLGAIFTYQLLYWLWVKLEKDEQRADKEAEMGALEGQLRDVAARRN